MTKKRGNDIKEEGMTKKDSNSSRKKFQRDKEIPEGLTKLTHCVIFVL